MTQTMYQMNRHVETKEASAQVAGANHPYECLDYRFGPPYLVSGTERFPARGGRESKGSVR
jgi:hypothetical protein